MSRRNGHHAWSLHSQTKRTLSSLSRKAINFIYPSRGQKAVTKRKGKRFSLISLAETQSDLASQIVRSFHRESVHRDSRSSDPRLGLHAVCPLCDGFVVKNGVVRNCEHQRESWSSFVHAKRETSPEGTDEPGSQTTGYRSMRLGRKRPVPSVLRPGHRSHTHFRKAKSIGKGLARPVPSILRPGYSPQSHIGKAKSISKGLVRPIPSVLRPGHGPHRKPDPISKEVVSLNMFVPSRPPRPTITAANDFSSLVCSVEDVGRSDHPCHEPDTLMQHWSEWSEGWEWSVGTINAAGISGIVLSAGDAVNESLSHGDTESRGSLGFDEERIIEYQGSEDGDSIDQPLCDPDALMQGWREWQEGWERRVKSR